MNSSSDVAEYVREHREDLVHVLRHCQDPYTRACALVLLREGGTERDLEKIKEDLDRWS